MLEQAKRGRTGSTTGARLAGANAWGAFGALQYIIYEYDNLSDGGVRASESPAKSVFRHVREATYKVVQNRSRQCVDNSLWAMVSAL